MGIREYGAVHKEMENQSNKEKEKTSLEESCSIPLHIYLGNLLEKSMLLQIESSDLV